MGISSSAEQLPTCKEGLCSTDSPCNNLNKYSTKQQQTAASHAQNMNPSLAIRV